MDFEAQLVLDRSVSALGVRERRCALWGFFPSRLEKILRYPELAHTPRVVRVTELMLTFLNEEERGAWAAKHVAVIADATNDRLRELIRKEKAFKMKPLLAMALCKKDWVSSRDVTGILGRNGVKSSNLGITLDDLAMDELIEVKVPEKGVKNNAERKCRLLELGYEELRGRIDNLEVSEPDEEKAETENE